MCHMLLEIGQPLFGLVSIGVMYVERLLTDIDHERHQVERLWFSHCHLDYGEVTVPRRR